jgi:hypothetical protein
MAEGGWKYYGWISNPDGGTNGELATRMAAWKSAFVSGLAALSSGWSLHADVTAYNSACWWWALEHTSGARLIWARCGDNSTGNVIEASNEAYNTTRIANQFEGSMWVAYVQPHLSGTALGANPATSGFLPTGSLKFFPVWQYNEWSGSARPGQFGHHILVRGSNVIYMYADTVDGDPQIDGINFMGECLDQLTHESHATEPDNHVDSLYGHLYYQDCNYAVSTWRCQFFDAEQAYRTTTSQTYNGALLTDNVVDREPWSWEVPTVYVSSNNLEPVSGGGAGIVTGSGIKGRINPEWMRYVMLPGGPANDKQRLNGGNFVYLRNGIAVGYDPTNGSML